VKSITFYCTELEFNDNFYTVQVSATGITNSVSFGVQNVFGV